MKGTLIMVVWILWAQGAQTGTWNPQDAFETLAECRDAVARIHEVQKNTGRPTSVRDFWTCFPDTFDPRGRRS